MYWYKFKSQKIYKINYTKYLNNVEIIQKIVGMCTYLKWYIIVENIEIRSKKVKKPLSTFIG